MSVSVDRNKENGVYDYRADISVGYKDNNPPGYGTGFGYGENKRVRVVIGGGPVNNVGFHEGYEIRRGDINGDGRVDLYVRSKPGNPAPVSDFVLRQMASKDFTLLTTLTSSQRSQVQGWPVADIGLTTGDFNVDGSVDLLLEGVGSLISGAFDQLVFAPRAANSPPLVVTALDQRVQKFFAEVGNALYDPDYFENYAPIAVQERVVQDWFFGPEYCHQVPELNPYGLLEFWPSLPPQELDYEAFTSQSIAFLAQCYADGDIYIHYDWLEVFYTVLVGSKDLSVFSPDAMEISRVLREILEDWSLPDDSDAKETVRIILESILGYPVFGPYLDDDDERRSLFVSIGYLARKYKGQAAVSLPKCPSPVSTIEYNTKRAAHTEKFELTSWLAPKISVTNDPDGGEGDRLITIEVTMAGIAFPGDSITQAAANAAEGWSSCGTLPDGKTVRLKVTATKLPLGQVDNADIKIVSEPESNPSCEKVGGFVRESEQRKQIHFCAPSKIDIGHVGMHEFGHVLGFWDMYVTDKTSPNYGDPLPGFKHDIMSSSGWQIFPYHLSILADMYDG